MVAHAPPKYSRPVRSTIRHLIDEASLAQPGEAGGDAAERTGVQAGIIRREDFEKFSEKDWDDVMGINISAVFFLSQQLRRFAVP